MNVTESRVIALLFFTIICIGCRSTEKMSLEELQEMDRQFEERMVKTANPRFFYNALYQCDVDLVRRLLEAGSDPNKCRSEFGWGDSNPLKIATVIFYNSYDSLKQIPKIIPEPAPDMALIQLLVEAGADVNRLPYVWDRVHRYTSKKIGSTEMIQIETYVKDANRVLRALLEAGADPDKLGHPYPFGFDWKVPFLTDKKANKYFAQGTRAINEAIEKGIIWESQVDLLLKYTSLDEESLKAADRSNDPAMIEKIQKLWQGRGAGAWFTLPGENRQ